MSDPIHFDIEMNERKTSLHISIASEFHHIVGRKRAALLHRACAALLDRKETGSAFAYVDTDYSHIKIEACDGENLGSLAYEASVALEEAGFVACDHLF